MHVDVRTKADLIALKAAKKNVADAKTLLKIAEKGVDNVIKILIEMNALAIRATSVSLNDASRACLEQEYNGLIQEIDRISHTKFNGVNLLDGTFGKATEFSSHYNVATNADVWQETITHKLDISKLKIVQSRDNTTTVLDMGINGASLDFGIAAHHCLGTFQGLRITQGTGSMSMNGNTVTTSNWEIKVGGKLYIASAVSDIMPTGANGSVTFTEYGPIAAVGAMFTMTNNTPSSLNLTSQVDANRLSAAINYAFKGKIDFQVGISPSDKMSISLNDISSGALGIAKTNIDSVGNATTQSKVAHNNMPAVAYSAGVGAFEAVDRLSKALDTAMCNQSEIKSYLSRLDHTNRSLSDLIKIHEKPTNNDINHSSLDQILYLVYNMKLQSEHLQLAGMGQNFSDSDE